MAWKDKLKKPLVAGSIAAGSLFPAGHEKPVRAQEAVQAATKNELSQEEKQIIDRCRQMIKDRQLGPEYGEAEGAINMRFKRNPKNPEDVWSAIQYHEVSGKLYDTITDEANKNIYKYLKHVQAALARGEINTDEVETTLSGLRVVPYFANFAMQALLEAYPTSQDFSDLEVVAKWMKFYAQNQDKETGYITDFSGSINTKMLETSGHYDSVDSYASTYLDLAKRYQEILKTLPQEKQDKLNAILPQEMMVNAAKLALHAIETVTDPASGRTIAKPDYKVEYLMDNVEVRCGLLNATDFFAATGCRAEAEKCREMASKLTDNLEVYRQKSGGGYHWARHFPKGQLERNVNQLAYPHALANVIALAYLPDADAEKNKALLQEITKKFPVEEPVTAARIFMAADRIGDTELRNEWRGKMLEEAKTHDDTTNVHRLGLSILGMTIGKEFARMPEPEKTINR